MSECWTRRSKCADVSKSEADSSDRRRTSNRLTVFGLDFPNLEQCMIYGLQFRYCSQTSRKQSASLVSSFSGIPHTITLRLLLSASYNALWTIVCTLSAVGKHESCVTLKIFHRSQLGAHHKDKKSGALGTCLVCPLVKTALSGRQPQMARASALSVKIKARACVVQC